MQIRTNQASQQAIMTNILNLCERKALAYIVKP